MLRLCHKVKRAGSSQITLIIQDKIRILHKATKTAARGRQLTSHLLSNISVHQQQSTDVLNAECIETRLWFLEVMSSRRTQA